MRTERIDVPVIDGMMTGAGALRDLTLRGLRATLVERGDFAGGTTGRYRGFLHSGRRYVTKDPVSACDCARENATLRRILPGCIEDTGGPFVVTPWGVPDYAEQFVADCRELGVLCEVPRSAGRGAGGRRDEPRARRFPRRALARDHAGPLGRPTTPGAARRTDLSGRAGDRSVAARRARGHRLDCAERGAPVPDNGTPFGE